MPRARDTPVSTNGEHRALAVLLVGAPVCPVTTLTVGQDIKIPATATIGCFASAGTLLGTYFGVEVGRDGQVGSNR